MLSELQKKKFTRLFKVWDTNGDGAIDERDFHDIIENIASAFGMAKGSQDYETMRANYLRIWEEMRHAADTDHDQQVKLGEFLAFHDMIVNTKEAYDELLKSFAHLLFDMFDRDRDGLLSLGELGMFYRAYRIADDAMTQRILKRIDLSGKGQLTRQMILQLIDEFHLSQDPQAPGSFLFGPID